MTTRRRTLFIVAIPFAAATCILLVLTLLHHALPALQAFDAGTAQRIHALASPRITALMLAFTWLGAIRTFIPALILAIALLAWQRRRRLAALLGLPMLAALILNQALKLYFHRPRPAILWPVPTQLLPADHTFSFPSGHTLFATVLYGTLALAALQRSTPPPRRVTLLALALAMPLAIGISRIYLGQHHPTDVLAGYLAGLLLLAATALIQHIVPPSEPPFIAKP